MGRRAKVLTLIAIWSIAIVAVVFLALRYPEEGTVDRGAPVRTAGSDHGDPESLRLEALVELPAADATQFRGDRRNTGRSPYRGPERASVAWTFHTEAPIVAQPVISPAGTVLVGSLDHHLYALNYQGEVLWEQDLGGAIYSTPLLDDQGNVYLGSDGGSFFSFGPDGTPRWRLVVEDDADTSARFSPARDRIYFGAGTDLWAVGLDGTIAWRFRTRAKIFSSPALGDDGTLYFGSQDHYFYAVADDGRARWEFEVGGDNDGAPLLSSATGFLYFGSDDRSLRGLTRTGELVFKADLGGYVRAPIALGLDGTVIAGVMGPRPRIVGLEPTTGAERWSFTLGSSHRERGVFSGAIVDRDGSIYFGAHDSYLYSLSQAGELRWAFEAGGTVDGTPALGPDGRLFVGCDDGNLYALGGDREDH